MIRWHILTVWIQKHRMNFSFFKCVSGIFTKFCMQLFVDFAEFNNLWVKFSRKCRVKVVVPVVNVKSPRNIIGNFQFPSEKVKSWPKFPNFFSLKYREKIKSDSELYQVHKEKEKLRQREIYLKRKNDPDFLEKHRKEVYTCIMFLSMTRSL